MISSLKWLHHEDFPQSKVLAEPNTDPTTAAIHQVVATVSD